MNLGTPKPMDRIFTATIIRRGALGNVELEGSLAGDPDYISKRASARDQQIATMTPGETMTIQVVHQMPEGHPLTRVDLNA